MKLFRNIRHQQLLSEKTRKYFLYALGEIALVVIGILIALQINNWKNFNEDREQEQFYLNKLEQNIQEDTGYLRFRIQQIHQAEEEYDRLIEEINDKNLKEFTKDSLVRQLVSVHRFSPQTSVMDNLVSTGKLDLIENQKLVDSLYIYYNDLNNFTAQWNNADDTYSRETIGPELLKMKGGIYKLVKADLTEEEKTFIINSVQLKRYINFGVIQNYELALGRAENLIGMIKKELDPYD